MYRKNALLLLVILLLPNSFAPAAHGYSDHPNLFVSAENSMFENHFDGSMVIEVIVKGNNNQLDQAQGEPNVNVNGRQLRMAQASDGYWYAFFADTEAAKQADQISLAGSPGQNLDFGVFCSSSTPSSVLGADFSQSDGVAIPDSNGLSGTTQGLASFGVCSGTPKPPNVNQDNVVKNPPSLNQNPSVSTGQIGINPNIWPIIQLFSLANAVTVEYDAPTGTQSVALTYFDIPNISLNLDRQMYPAGSDVFATINDIQLDEDPTAVDSWTFNVASPDATFYQAFPEFGGGGTTGLVNLSPYLGSLGFRDNGRVEMNTGNVVGLKTNGLQTSSSISAKGVTYNNLVTFVETGPNTGIFSTNYNDVSTLGVLASAPRGQAATLEYDLQSASIVSGTTTAGLSLGGGQGTFGPGQREQITLTDRDQVLNSGIVETLNVFRSSAVIPTLKIGDPVTLVGASGVNFYPDPATLANPISVPSSVTDPNSARLVIDTRSTPATNFYAVTANLGVTAGDLDSLLIDTSQPNSAGTDWVNYDLRSFQLQLGVGSFSGVSMTLHFGGAKTGPSVQLVPPGSISSANGLVQISSSAVTSIESQPASVPVYLEINFGSSGGAISQETDTQPIVFDIFSFGMKNNQPVNNAIYRAELQETGPGSGVFAGTVEYVVANQLNQFDPNFIKGLQTFGSNIVFLVNSQMVDQNGINFSIKSSAGGQPAPVTSKSSLPTHTGTVTLDSASYRLGSTVTITLDDPDLASDTIQSFTTVSDPTSPNADTVGDGNGNILLEVWIKGFRFHQCTIDGVFHGGLAATGFTLTETAPGSGIYKGSFKMPSWICNQDGTALISPIGGTVQAWYHDYMDAYGRSVIVGSTVASSTSTPTEPTQRGGTTAPPPTAPPIPYVTKITHVTQVGDANGLPLLGNPKVGQAVTFNDIISNGDYQKDQKISYIVQVKDNQGKVVYLKWISDSIGPSSQVREQVQWTPNQPGAYSAQVYVWNGMDSLVPLTVQNGYNITVMPP
ncbi:MAG: peptidase [Thaumarchaeota archaeon]|nr:peptidase [Nitrososphaerota archaeon]